MLAQFAFLGRALEPVEFATFLLAYSIAAIFSQTSDGGQHVTLFSVLRSGKLGDPGDIRARVLGALAIKLIASLGWAAAILIAGAAIPALDTTLVLIALMLGVAMPVGDVFLNVLRGYFRADLELALLLSEYGAGIAALYLYSLRYALTAYSALGVLILLGIIRTFASLLLTRPLVRGKDVAITPRSLGLRSLGREALPVTFAALVGVGFSRLPPLTLHGRLEATDYAVLIAFLSLFGRGELVVSAVMQAGFRSGHAAWKRFAERRHLILAAFGTLAVPIAAVATIWPQGLTTLYLGSAYTDSAPLAAIAALAMFMYYPLYGCRLLLQFTGRNSAVLRNGLAGASGYFIALQLVSNKPGSWQLIPYLSGLGIFLSLSTVTLLRDIAADEI